MSSASELLLQKANELIKKAKELEFLEHKKVGEAILKLHKAGKIKDQNVLDAISNVLDPKKPQKESLASEE